MVQQEQKQLEQHLADIQKREQEMREKRLAAERWIGVDMLVFAYQESRLLERQKTETEKLSKAKEEIMAEKLREKQLAEERFLTLSG